MNYRRWVAALALALAATGLAAAAAHARPRTVNEIVLRDKHYPNFLKRFSKALDRYVKRNDGRIPRSPEALAPLLKSRRGSRNLGAVVLLSGHFTMVDLLGRRMEDIDAPETTVFIYQRLPGKDGSHWVLHVGGGVERLSRKTLEARLKAQGADPPPQADEAQAPGK